MPFAIADERRRRLKAELGRLMGTVTIPAGESVSTPIDLTSSVVAMVIV